MARKIGRAILKLSGELFSDQDHQIAFSRYDQVSRQLIDIVKKTKIQLAVVVGGGNILRGREASSNVDRSEADHMGMLATVINGIGLKEALIRNGASDPRLMTAVGIDAFAEPFIRNKGIHHLENNRIVIVAGGLGLPNFSTDSAVAQYADEFRCEIILKASTVNGVYDFDPKENKNAKRFKTITYSEAFEKNLKVMDQTAFAMCLKSKIPIFVFDIKNLGKIPDILKGDYSFGTLVTD